MFAETHHIAAIDAVSLLTTVVAARAAYDSSHWDDDDHNLAMACWNAVDAASAAGIPDDTIGDAREVLATLTEFWGLS